MGPLAPILGGTPRFVVGQVPVGWPAGLVPSAPVRVLGGATFPVATMAVFVYPLPTQRAVEEYAALGRGAGWRAGVLPERSRMAGLRSVVLCGDSVFVAVVAVDSVPDRTTLNVMLWPTRDGAYSPACDTTSHVLTLKPTVGSSMTRSVLPALEPPAGKPARWLGQSSNNGFESVSVALETTASPDSLLGHFAAQLAAAGWTLRTRSSTNDLSAQTIERTGDDGQRWIGAVSVLRLGSTCEVDVRVRHDDRK